MALSKTTELIAIVVAIIVVCVLLMLTGKEGYGTLPQMTLSRIVPFPTINQDYLTYNTGHSTNYVNEADPYQHQVIMNLGPYPAPPRSPTDTSIKDYIKTNYLQQVIPEGGLYGPADIGDLNYAYSAYNTKPASTV